MDSSRRRFLTHAGALGLGMIFSPSLGSIARAEGHSLSNSSSENVPGLVFEVVEAGGLAHYSYFLADRSSGQAVVVDPRRDVEVYLELASKNEVDIVTAVETHIHADFLSGARELKARTGKTKIAASVEGGATYGFPLDRELRHGDQIEFGRFVLKALHTPGHTPEHMAYLACEKERTGNPRALFTGDFLFVGSVGRPDLMGVENTDRLAKILYQTVKSGFDGLPDSLAIFPAHGPGSPCGAGIQRVGGQPTLGRERSSNPYLHLNSEESFINTLLDAQPPIPYYWPRMKQLNASGPKVLGKPPRAKSLSVDEFRKLRENHAVQILDTRQTCAYAGGHIPASLNIGYDEVLSLWGGWFLDPKRPLVLIVPVEGSTDNVMAWLSRVGLEENVVGALGGGVKAWINEAMPFENYLTLSIHQVKSIFPTDKMQLLDVRQPSEWDMGHLPGARYIFLPELEKRHTELDRGKPVVVYCGNGYRAGIGVSVLRKLGYDARSVPGSYTAWQAAKYPVVYPKGRKPASLTVRG